MSNNEWSIETPKRTPLKQQKTESKISLKIEFMEVPKTSYYLLHVFISKMMLTGMDEDVRALNKGGQN
jgi:hypothetical protein